jgi:hypothetical protein
MEQVVGSEIFIAECYANQATPYFLINNYFWSKATGTQVVTLAPGAYDAVTSYAKFARTHKDLLTHVYRSYADVALVYSVPSFLYKVCSAMQLSSGNELYQRQAANLTGMAQVLERSNMPYDVVVFGSTGYWNDDNLAETLNRYRVIILPNVESLTEKQAEAVRDYTGKGGRVIVSGELGVRDERYRRREKSLLEGDLDGRMVRVGDAAETLMRTLHEKIKTEAGARQRLTLNQQSPKTIMFHGWSKAEKVSGHADSDYSIYLDIIFQDGSSLWAQTANFATGTHDWQMAQSTVEVEKPVKTVEVLALFRRRTGKVWFDDIFVGEVGSDRNLLGDWQPYRNGFQRDPAVTRGGKPAICCVIAPSGPVNISQIDGFKRIAETLKNTMSSQTPVLETSAPETVAVNPILRDNHLIVHLLNYDCDPDADTLVEKKDVKVSVRLPKDTRPGPMTLCVPGLPDAQLQGKVSGQSVEFTVPQIRVWAIVHCNLIKP